MAFRTYNHVQLSAKARDAILSALRDWHGIKIHLFSAVVMPDHVHVVFKLLTNEDGDSEDLSRVMHSIKSYSANQVNESMGRAGILWQVESYDHITRDARDFHNTLSHIYYDPFKKGLCGESPYPWYVEDEVLENSDRKPAPRGRINYTVCSEAFSCPECSGEIVFLEEALDKETQRVHDEFPCPSCGARLTKKGRLQRLYEARFDATTGASIKAPKRRPVLINYSVGKAKYEKPFDDADRAILQRIEAMPLPPEVPTNPFPIDELCDGSRLEPKGFTPVHHMFLPRSAQALAVLWRKASTGQGRQDAGSTVTTGDRAEQASSLQTGQGTKRLREACVEQASGLKTQSDTAHGRQDAGSTDASPTDAAEIISERTPQMLHDRMIAFGVQRRVAVPLSGPDFFAGLDARHPGATRWSSCPTRPPSTTAAGPR